MTVPDPDRLGGIGWLESTMGALSAGERRRLVYHIARGQLSALAGRVKLMTGRRPDEIGDLPEPPDSKLAREAEDACAEQPASIVGHSYRTWAFGRALAAVDRSTDLDDELFYVAALLHDAGLAEAVAGEDFTLRSARRAAACAEAHRPAADVRRLQDAISAHATPGASPSVDGAEGFYLQAGATLDLAGLRLADVPAAFVDQVHRHHPRDGVTAEIVELVKAEAEAVPDGRFSLLNKSGFTLAIRFAPYDVK